MKRVRRAAAVLSSILLLAAIGCQRRTTEPAEGEIPGLVKAGQLTIGSDIPFEPFEFEKDGKLTGFDVELVEEMAKRLDLKPEWVDTDFATIFTQLAAGKFDMVASATTITDERKKQVDFTDGYMVSLLALVINTTKTPNVKTTNDLKSGDTVAVQDGTTSKTYADGQLAPKGVQVRAFPEAPDTYTALEAGQVTAVIFDEPSAIAEVNKRPTLKIVYTFDTGDRYGFAVNPQNSKLLSELNRVLKEMIEDGTYARIFGKYPDLPKSGDVSKSS